MGKAGYLFFFPLLAFGLIWVIVAFQYGYNLFISIFVLDGYNLNMAAVVLAVCFLFGYLLWEIVGEPTEEYGRQVEQERTAARAAEKARKDQERENLRKEQEAKERQEAAERTMAPLVRRIKSVLRKNPGELYTENELRYAADVTTASEDSCLWSALRSLPYNEGFRKTEEEVAYGVYKKYYYYVDPDE